MPAGSKRKAPPLRDAHTASPRPPRDPADDCETPAVAYAHLAPLLTKLAQRLKKPVADLRVWDPYHCAGGVISRLGALGFTHVVNDPELDFYDVVDGAAPPPPHDVLVTNPPFSGNHARALFQYLRSKDGRKATRRRSRCWLRSTCTGRRGTHRGAVCFTWCPSRGTSSSRRAGAGRKTRTCLAGTGDASGGVRGVRRARSCTRDPGSIPARSTPRRRRGGRDTSTPD